MLLDLAANVTAPVLDTVGSSIRLDRSVEKDMARKQIKVCHCGDRPGSVGRESFRRKPAEGSFGRWVTSSRTALILDEPTRGVDVGAKVENLPDDSSACPSGTCDHHDQLGAARDRRPVRSGHGAL